jgi:hypothetical protein
MNAKTSQAYNTDEDEVTSRKMEQCEKLLKENAEKKSTQKPSNSNRHLTVQPWIQDLSTEEAEDVIVKIKNHKAPGKDTICAE